MSLSQLKLPSACLLHRYTLVFEGQSNLVICDQLTQYLVTHSSHLSRLEINFGHPRTAHDCTAVIFAISNMHMHESITMDILEILVLERIKLNIL